MPALGDSVRHGTAHHHHRFGHVGRLTRISASGPHQIVCQAQIALGTLIFTSAAEVFLLKTIPIDNPTFDHGESGRDVL